MEFVYTAFCGSETSQFKGKISRYRHLESTLLQLLLVGLVAFVVLQNGHIQSSMR